MEQYEDMINLTYKGSKQKNKMRLLDRAAQFAPFSALSGYGEAILEAARITDSEIEIGESEREELNYRIQEIADQIQTHPFVQITYFSIDSNKDGGSYQNLTGQVKKIDEVKKELILMDGLKIQIHKILHLEIGEPDL